MKLHSLFVLITLAIFTLTSSCTPEAKVLPSPIQEQISTSVLSHGDIQTAEISVEPSDKCRDIGEVIDVRNTKGCSYVIKLREGKILYPVNWENYKEEMKDGSTIQFSIERVEVKDRDCELGLPIKISEICRVEYGKDEPGEREEKRGDSKRN